MFQLIFCQKIENGVRKTQKSIMELFYVCYKQISASLLLFLWDLFFGLFFLVIVNFLFIIFALLLFTLVIILEFWLFKLFVAIAIKSVKNFDLRESIFKRISTFTRQIWCILFPELLGCQWSQFLGDFIV